MANEVVVRHHGFPNDDIVTALRTMVQFTNSVAGGVCWRAADEIERLRADLEEMRQVVISEHRRWCDRPCNAEEWNLHD